MGTRQKEMQDLLVKYLDSGLTTADAGQILGMQSKQAKKIMESLYSVYIDRWVVGRAGRYEPVYCICPPPEDCPEPEGVIRETRWGSTFAFVRSATA